MTEIIDFFETQNHSIRGLQATIKARLQISNTEAFQPYDEILKQLKAVHLEHGTVYPSAVANLEARANKQFLECCQQAIIGQEVVLFFDTFERIQRQEVGKWLLEEFLPNVRGAIIVLAGRPGSDSDQKNPDNIVVYDLEGLSLEETAEYIRKYDPQISQADVQIIWTHTYGIPLFIDLLFFDQSFAQRKEYLTELKQSTEIERIQDSPDWQRRLVKQFTEASTQNRVIWAMAHLRRRFDDEMLQYIIQYGEWFNPGDYHDIFKELEQSACVKEYAHQQSHLLHDEVQQMVAAYIPGQVFGSQEDIRKLEELIIRRYYPEKIAAVKEEDPELARQLQAEHLGYFLDHFPDAGLLMYAEYRDQIEKTHDYDFEELLWGEVSEYLDHLNDQSASFALTKQTWENLRYRGIPDNTLESLKFLENQEITGESNFLKAVEKQIGSELTVQYKELILKHADKAYQLCKERVDWLRKHSLFQKSGELAQHMIKQFPAYPIETRTSFGFMLIRQGKMVEAEQVLKESRSLAQKNEFQTIAMIENTLGQLMYLSGRWEEALKHYARGLRAATLAQDSSYMASVYLNRGFLYSMQGLYYNARQQCENALELLRSLSENRENTQRMIYAYMNLGSVYRHRHAQIEDYAQARDYYQKSLKIAQNTNNQEAVCDALQHIEINAHLWGRTLRRDLWEQRMQSGCQEPFRPQEFKDLTEVCEQQLFAWRSLTESLDIARKAEWRKAIAEGLHRLAKVYREISRIEELLSRIGEYVEVPGVFGELKQQAGNLPVAFEVEYEQKLLTSKHFEELETWMEKAIRLFDLCALIADEVNDFHRTLDSLTELVRTFVELKNIDAIPIVIRRIERIKSFYQTELFAEMNEINWGDLDFIRGNFDAALAKYKHAYAEVAKRSGYASYLLADRLRDLRWHLRDLPPQIRVEWCDELEEAWLESGISATRSDMFHLLERIRADTLKDANS